MSRCHISAKSSSQVRGVVLLGVGDRSENLVGGQGGPEAGKREDDDGLLVGSGVGREGEPRNVAPLEGVERMGTAGMWMVSTDSEDSRNTGIVVPSCIAKIEVRFRADLMQTILSRQVFESG